MIRPIDIKLNAAHPELPLVEATTFTGAPSSVFIRGVPKNCGNWSITAVNVAVTYPDNTTTTRAAVESAEGVWVATMPETATSGRTTAGFRILADGIDENGAAVTGYVLGFADFSVLSFAPVPAPGGTFWLLRYFDAMPTTPKKGDVAVVSGVLKYYNGTTWLPFADLSNYYTKAEADDAIERVAAYYITADAQGNPFATYVALVNAQTYYSGGSVRIPTRNDYAVVSADETHGGAKWRYIYAVDAQGIGQWEPQHVVEGVIAYDDAVSRTSANGVKSSGIWSAIWGALSALPSGFSSLYDWCVAQFAKYLPLTGGTITGTLTLAEVDGGGTEIIKAYLGSESSQKFVVGVFGGNFYIGQYGYRLWLPYASGNLALLSQIGILAFDATATYAVGAKVVYSNAVWNCTTKVSTSGAWTGATNWTKLFDLAVDSTPTANSNSLMTSGVIKTALDAKANRASDPTAGNLAALDASGNPTDAGYRFEVRNGIPYIIETTND